MTSRFREIPSVNEVLRRREVTDLIATHSHESVVEIVRERLASVRRAVSEGGEPPGIETVAGRRGGPRRLQVEELAGNRH